jgi:glycosyltransferase involved in cell wall biosynthesis
LYIGAHGKANYLWQLIQTAELLRNDPEYLIVCVGNGMERDALIQKAKQDNLTNIQFLPSVAKCDVYKYLNACNVSLIVLKKVDAFKTVYPNKMFDSMAAARPVILAIDGVARKLIEDGKAGIYVEPENAEEIVNAMKLYRSSPETALLHGQNGYEFVKQNYDRRNLAAKYIKLIEEKVIRNPNK